VTDGSINNSGKVPLTEFDLLKQLDVGVLSQRATKSFQQGT
jgi:hypothetical protein